ncbi:MAG TPA: type II toxin-antitoxin system VapC family toxin [Candidatus Saccharimonadales bacterium]|jgi:ribonuclease VapC
MANHSNSDDLFVLDTSALLTLHDDEPGAAEVEALLAEVGSQQKVWICFVSLMEFSYIVQQKVGVEKARRSYAQLKQLPLMVVESGETLGLMAANIKAMHQVSLADAWIAATAQQLNATLMHKDPEFEELSQVVKLHSLPYKPKTSKKSLGLE